MSFDVLSEINYLAALVAAVAYFAFGALWYAPPLLGRAWQKAAGISQDQAQSPSPMLFVGTFVAYFLAAVTLAAIALHTGASELMDGVILGLFVGIGVVATTVGVNIAYQRQSSSLFWINAINGVIGYVIMAVIVTMWD